MIFGGILSILLLLVSFVWCEDPPFTDKVTFHISHGEEEVGQLVIGLFGTVVPKTVENFVNLANMTYGYGYDQSIFHRIIRNFMIQGGDFERGTGTGGYSIYDKKAFDDENFTLKHDKVGRVSMANAGANTNGAQFFITTAVTSWLDGHHVVFGQVTDGTDVLDKLQKVETARNDRPAKEVKITKIAIERNLAIDTVVEESAPESSPVIKAEPPYQLLMLLAVMTLVTGGALFYKIRKESRNTSGFAKLV